MRISRKLTALTLVFLFIAGTQCVTMATETLSVETAVHAGSEYRSDLEEAECDYASLICLFFSHRLLATVQFRDLPKYVQCLTISAASIGPPNDETSVAENRISAASLIFSSEKVSIHLFNSVLSL